MNELNKLYQAMLTSWGCDVKDDGRIVIKIGQDELPIKIDDMEMYLPLSEVLNGNVINKVFFHPACENITSKETEVFKIIRRLTIMKLLSVFRDYPIVLFTIAAGEKPKKAWPQWVIDMMEPLKAAKRPVREELSKLFERLHVELGEDGLDNRFLHFVVTKGGGRKKETSERVYYRTKPTFPFYNEIIKRLSRSEGQADNQTVELNNFTVSRAALKLAAHLFQSILPGVQSPNDYEFESTNHVAARLVSYLGSYHEISDQLNRVQNLFRGEFDKAGIHMIDLGWNEYIDELPDTYRQVPILDYNSHNTQDEPDQSAQRNDMAGLFSVSSQPKTVVVQQQYPQQQQYVQQQYGQQQYQVNGDFDMTPPSMLGGDRYIRSEVDHTSNQVIHHAISLTNVPIVYHCTRRGTFLQRVEMSNANLNMGGMGNFGGNNPLQALLVTQMMQNMMNNNNNGGGGVPATNVYPDNTGYNTAPATW